MRPSRRLGIVVLLLLGASGCAGVQSRMKWSARTSEEATPSRSSGWFGSRLWSRPTPTSASAAAAGTAAPDAETARRSAPETDIWPTQRSAGLSRLFPLLGHRDGGKKPGPAQGAYPSLAALSTLATPADRRNDRQVRPASGEEAATSASARQQASRSRAASTAGGAVPDLPPSPIADRDLVKLHDRPHARGDVALEVAAADLNEDDEPTWVTTPQDRAASSTQDRPEVGEPSLDVPLQDRPRRESHLIPAAAGAADLSPTRGDESVGLQTKDQPKSGRQLDPPPPLKPGPGAKAARSSQTPKQPAPSAGGQQRSPTSPAPRTTTPSTTTPSLGPAPPPLPATAPKPATEPAPAPAQTPAPAPALPAEPVPTAEPGPRPVAPTLEPTPPAPAVQRPAPAPADRGLATAPAHSRAQAQAQAASGQGMPASAQAAPSPQASVRSPVKPEKPPHRRWSLLAWVHSLHQPAPPPKCQLPPVMFPTTYQTCMPGPRPTGQAWPGSVHPAPQSQPSPRASARPPCSTLAPSASCCSWFHYGMASDFFDTVRSWRHGCVCHCHDSGFRLWRGTCKQCASKRGGPPAPAASPQATYSSVLPRGQSGLGSWRPEPRDLPEGTQVLERIASQGLDKAP